MRENRCLFTTDSCYKSSDPGGASNASPGSDHQPSRKDEPMTIPDNSANPSASQPPPDIQREWEEMQRDIGILLSVLCTHIAETEEDLGTEDDALVADIAYDHAARNRRFKGVALRARAQEAE